jgi:hypothetical protein
MHALRRAFTLAPIALLILVVAARAKAPEVQAQDQKDKKVIHVTGKCFDSDHPDQRIDPILIIATVRPGPGQAPVLKDIKPRIENEFFVLDFEYNDFIESLTFEFAGDYNAGILKKLICKKDMTVYFAASDAERGIFNFPGYTAQFGTYRDIFNELTKLGRTPEQLRTEFGRRLMKMPAADDDVRLPSLTAEERVEARRAREGVLRLYGLLPPESPKASLNNAEAPTICCPPTYLEWQGPVRCRGGLFRRFR